MKIVSYYQYALINGIVSYYQYALINGIVSYYQYALINGIGLCLSQVVMICYNIALETNMSLVVTTGWRYL